MGGDNIVVVHWVESWVVSFVVCVKEGCIVFGGYKCEAVNIMKFYSIVGFYVIICYIGSWIGVGDYEDEEYSIMWGL